MRPDQGRLCTPHASTAWPAHSPEGSGCHSVSHAPTDARRCRCKTPQRPKPLRAQPRFYVPSPLSPPCHSTPRRGSRPNTPRGSCPCRSRLAMRRLTSLAALAPQHRSPLDLRFGRPNVIVTRGSSLHEVTRRFRAKCICHLADVLELPSGDPVLSPSGHQGAVMRGWRRRQGERGVV